MRKSSRNSAASNDQNIYGLTRNTRPREVQFILSGSKRFRKNGGPHLKGSRRPRKKVARPLLLRRPKVVFFGAQAEKKRFFLFFFGTVSLWCSAAQKLFRPPPKQFRPPHFFSAPNLFFSAAFFFSAPKTRNRLFRRAPKEQYFSAPKRETSTFFFFSAPPRCSVRRPNNFFDPPKNIFRRLFIFLGAPKNRRFSAPKTKNRLFRRAPKEQKVAFWVHPPYEPLAVKIVLRFSKGFRVYLGTHLEGPQRLRMKGS